MDPKLVQLIGEQQVKVWQRYLSLANGDERQARILWGVDLIRMGGCHCTDDSETDDSEPVPEGGPVVGPNEPLPYPDDATEQQKACMDLAYLLYLVTYANCSTNQCRIQAWTAYQHNVSSCFPV